MREINETFPLFPASMLPVYSQYAPFAFPTSRIFLVRVSVNEGNECVTPSLLPGKTPPCDRTSFHSPFNKHPQMAQVIVFSKSQVTVSSLSPSDLFVLFILLILLILWIHSGRGK